MQYLIMCAGAFLYLDTTSQISERAEPAEADQQHTDHMLG